MLSKRFREHRQALLNRTGDGIIILEGADETVRNSDVHHPFRQHSNFLYLTGFTEPQAILVLIRSGRKTRTILFVQPRDPKMELWIGERVGTARAKKIYEASEAYPISDFSAMLKELLSGKTRLFLDFNENSGFSGRVIARLGELSAQTRDGRQYPREVVNIDDVLADMRLYKSEEEVQLMRRAAAVTRDAFARMVAALRPGLTESRMQAELEGEFIRHGTTWAYYPIVAAGTNALTLHYIRNNDVMQAGDLLLVDAGCEYEAYSCDVTRTYPVKGRFTPAQKKLYQVVLSAQEAAINAVKPGVSFRDIDDIASRKLAEGLVKLKILSGSVEMVLARERHKRFYPHSTSHWLGLDTHDVGRYRTGEEWRRLEPGMVLTIEPGLYIPKKKKGVPAEYSGIGIRIEDDILVTEDGYENLTRDIPKTVSDIEAAMKNRPA